MRGPKIRTKCIFKVTYLLQPIIPYDLFKVGLYTKVRFYFINALIACNLEENIKPKLGHKFSKIKYRPFSSFYQILYVYLYDIFLNFSFHFIGKLDLNYFLTFKNISYAHDFVRQQSRWRSISVCVILQRIKKDDIFFR